MKYKKKPYKARKVYRRKKGGPKFQFSAKSQWGPAASFATPKEQDRTQAGIVTSLLQKMGFRVEDR